VIELPTGPTRDYLAAFGVACVYVAAPVQVQQPLVIGHARDLSRALNWLRRDGLFSEYNIETAWWVRERGNAAYLSRVAGDYLGHDATVQHAKREIEKIARENNVVLTEHVVAMERVSRATAQIEHELRRAQRDGRLKFFNQAYKRHRAEGGTLHYRKAFARLRRALFLRIAHMRPSVIDTELLRDVFAIDNEKKQVFIRARPGRAMAVSRATVRERP
jgi:hypothetical protein